MHINPKFANRPLPSIPPPKPVRTSLARTQSFSPSKVPQPQPKEPVYAKLGDPSLKIDRAKKDNFEESIRKSVENHKVLINPNFSTVGGVGDVVTRRPRAGVPSKPVRHSMMVTSEMTKHLDLKLKKVKSVACITPKAILDKENLPSTSKSKSLFTPLRKSAFKKIGSRKLVRRKSKSPGTPKASFKKIGNKKLIRVVESKESSKTPYDVKTKTKIIKNVKNTPSNVSKYRFSFITPLSMKKSRAVRNSGSLKKTSGKKSLSSFRSRFKLDRRGKASKAEPKVLFQNSGQPRLKTKVMSGSTYRVSATRLNKLSQAPPKPHRGRAAAVAAVPASLAANKVISVQGVKFSVADNGRKLRRIPSTSGVSSNTNMSYSASMSCQATTTTSSSPQTDHKADSGISSSPVSGVTNTATIAGGKKMYLGGEELEEVEPGVFTRSRHSLTRQSITQAKNRSINTIMKNATRSKQYCMFFNKFGKCNKKEAGNCPFIHDKEKIAVCRRFLQGSCHKDNCLLSHKASPEKMPVCKYFLEGVCSKEACPYLHVKVSEKAAICPAFLKGYCSNGSDCTLRHVMACPEYDKVGVCSKPAGKCPFPHVSNTAGQAGQAQPGKKVAPAKPKRKSLGQTPADHKKSRVAARTTGRYYEDTRVEEDQETPLQEDTKVTPELESKRKRLLRKIELAKQGWTGVSVSVIKDETEELNDSGPYEKIDSDSSGEEEKVSREPVGQLGDFISLAGYSSEDEEIHTDHRLI